MIVNIQQGVRVLYEDNHIIVAVKPAGILSQADSSDSIDMLTILKKYIKDKYDKKGNVFLGLLHRLDRNVGGVMVFARTSKAASRISEQIRNKTFEKLYYCILSNSSINNDGTLKDYLLKNESDNIVKVVSSHTKGAKECILKYKVLCKKNELCKVEVQLITGRSHQIRVQFSNISAPLLGDKKYGENKNLEIKDIALWAYKISFNHPITKIRLDFIKEHPETYPWNVF